MLLGDDDLVRKLNHRGQAARDVDDFQVNIPLEVKLNLQRGNTTFIKFKKKLNDLSHCHIIDSLVLVVWL